MISLLHSFGDDYINLLALLGANFWFSILESLIADCFLIDEMKNITILRLGYGRATRLRT
jgi:hypothetical protein